MVEYCKRYTVRFYKNKLLQRRVTNDFQTLSYNCSLIISELLLLRYLGIDDHRIESSQSTFSQLHGLLVTL